MSGGSEKGPIYITRGMKSMCEFGSAPKGNYLNIVKDHGVLSGEEPLLNANDHTSDTIVGYGNCSSPTNPEVQAKKGVSNFLLGGSPLNFLVKAVTGKSATDVLMDIGLLGCRCKPDTPLVWQKCDEEHILDGAPALTLDSILFCRKGGVITISEPEKAEGDSQTPEESPENVVDDAAKAALAEAMEKINGAASEEGGSEGGTPDGGGQEPEAPGGGGQDGAPKSQAPVNMAPVQMMAMAAMSVLPAAGASKVMPSLGLAGSAGYTPVYPGHPQRKENLAYNKALPFPSEALDSQGLIRDISRLDAFKIHDLPVSIAGGGAVAAYNAIKETNPLRGISFAEVIYGVEAYGAVKTEKGMFTPGIGDYLVKQGCKIQYFMPGERLPDRKLSPIGMSLEDGLLQFKSLVPQAENQYIPQFSLMAMHKNTEEPHGTF